MTSDGEVDADAKVAALEDLRDELQEEPVKDTRLAGLYEEVTTAPPQLWNRATAFIDCEVVSSAELRSADRSSGARRERREGLDDANGEAVSGQRGGETASNETSAERSSASSRTGEARETTAEPSPGPREDEANDLDEASGEAASSESTSEANDLDDESGGGDADVRARAVVTDVSKLARGWWAPEIVADCDAMVTVDVHAELPLQSFAALATEEIEESIDSIRADGADDEGSPL